jgi:hypothetical protein
MSKAASVGAGQQITDCHPSTVGAVEKQRIAEFEFRLHGVAASWSTEITIGDSATELSGVDENVYPAARRGAVQLG